jgi:hypothetical protein
MLLIRRMIETCDLGFVDSQSPLDRAAVSNLKEACQFFLHSSSLDELLHISEHGYE